jgi:hypothetical protein
MSKLVVFQWGRLGDLVQTGIVLSRWRAQIGGKISLVYDRRYHDVVDALVDVENRFPLDLQQLVESSRGNVNAKDAFKTLNAIVGDRSSLRGGSHLILSRSSSASLMSFLLEPDRRLGYAWTRNGLHVPPLMSDYLNETCGHQPYPIHLSDVWSMLAEVECSPPDTCEHDNLQGCSNGILIFADAGESYRTPPCKWLAKLGEMLICEGEYKLTFVGSKLGLKDDPISQLSAIHRYRMQDLRGNTSLKNVIELCQNHGTAIGSDTGGLHLAEVCGCRPIGLYFGGASVCNTGPYCERAVALQNLEWTQGEHETVLQLIQNESTLSDSRVWRPVWDAGGMTYYSEGQSSQQNDAIQGARNNFLEKWMMPSRRQRQAFAANNPINKHAAV